MNIVEYSIGFCALTISAFLMWIMITISMALYKPRDVHPKIESVKVKKINHEVSCLLDEDGWHTMQAEEIR